MVEEPIIDVVKRYLEALPKYGIHPAMAVIYGSFARGEAHEWSDIDLLVVAPEFDMPYTIREMKTLWRATEAADDRIEPIPCGVREWEGEDARPIIEMARAEGVEIAA